MKALIFGITGSVGSYITKQFTEEGIKCIGTTHSKEKVTNDILFVDNNDLSSLKSIKDIDIIIWAHGYNINDNINTFSEDKFLTAINSNVLLIINSLKILLTNNSINVGANLIIISSIWEKNTRDNKLSYSVSKSALGGLVKSLSYDLASKNIRINNLCPGVIDNEMSRKTLSREQFTYLKEYTPFNRLINLEDVYNTVNFFAIRNTGITGQSITIDLGFTNIKKYS
jgi:NAD(P)-dependent dehydrogenase (short-subunit alcohol dehydrogenase family)